jgi:uncharacterized membrane protein HdeD (DUF308 family)
MSEHAATPQHDTPSLTGAPRAIVRDITGYWWALLVAGIAWVVVALVILQFDHASVTTVGILVGLMFTLAGIQNLALASVPGMTARWAWALFGALFLVSAVICFVNPENTFAGLADILGFLFLLVGVWWMVRAFLERAVNSGLVARARLRHPDDDRRVLDLRPVLHREGLRPPRLRRDLGVDDRHHRHGARLRDPPAAREPVARTNQRCRNTAPGRVPGPSARRLQGGRLIQSSVELIGGRPTNSTLTPAGAARSMRGRRAGAQAPADDSTSSRPGELSPSRWEVLPPINRSFGR